MRGNLSLQLAYAHGPAMESIARFQDAAGDLFCGRVMFRLTDADVKITSLATNVVSLKETIPVQRRTPAPMGAMASARCGLAHVFSCTAKRNVS